MLNIDENVNSAVLFAELQQKESGGVSFNTYKCANKWISNCEIFDLSYIRSTYFAIN